MLQVILLALTFVNPPVDEHSLAVDILEYNSVVECNGDIILSQVILWRWYPRFGQHHVVDWKLTQQAGQLQRLDKRWTVIIYSSNHRPLYRVVAQELRIRHTVYDPEINDRKIWPLQYRDPIPQ